MFIVKWEKNGKELSKTFDTFTLADEYYDFLIDESIVNDFQTDKVQVYEILSNDKFISLYKDTDKFPYMVVIENLETGTQEIKFFKKGLVAKKYYESMYQAEINNSVYYITKILNSTYIEE